MSGSAFRHEALLYADESEFLAGTTAFVRDAVEREEPILVVVDAAKIAALRAVLGDSADHVQFADMADVGHNPARIIPAWQRFVARNSGHGQRIRGLGEPMWAGRSPVELLECRQHEALLNLAFADVPGFWLLCPYDTTSLDPAVVDEACATHPHVVACDGSQLSGRYQGVDAAELLAEALPAPPEDAASLVFGPAVAPVRRFATAWATAAGWVHKAGDVALAVGELAANSVRHGGGRGRLQIWQDDSALICQVQDDGQLSDALVGRREPLGDQPGSRGLWLVNQICDLVQIRSSPKGTTVRIHIA